MTVSKAQQTAEKLNPDGSSTDGCLPAVLAVLASVLMLGVAQAAPPAVPFSPYGTVKVTGANVSDGTVISAVCGGVVYRQTTTLTYLAESWYANLDIPGDDPETTTVTEGCTAQEQVSFKIGELWAAQAAPWVSGESPRLDLTAGEPTAVKLRSFTAH